MTRVLNVDGLAQEKREIVLNGKTHEIKELSVDGFLATMDFAKSKEGDTSTGSGIDSAVHMILLAIPTLTVSDIRALPPQHMWAIVNFIQGDVPDEIKQAVSEAKAAETGNVTA